MNNIFEDAMAAFEFTDAIAQKIADDWKGEGIAPANLYNWLQTGFIDSLTEAVRKKVERDG